MIMLHLKTDVCVFVCLYVCKSSSLTMSLSRGRGPNLKVANSRQPLPRAKGHATLAEILQFLDVLLCSPLVRSDLSKSNSGTWVPSELLSTQSPRLVVERPLHCCCKATT